MIDKAMINKTVRGTVYDTVQGRLWLAVLMDNPGKVHGPAGLDDEGRLCVEAEGGSAWWCARHERIAYPGRPCGC